MPLFDSTSSMKKTSSVTGATTVNTAAMDLGSAGPWTRPVWVHCYYPQTPTGTGPTVRAMLQESADGSTGWVDLALVHDTLTGTTGYPRYRVGAGVPTKRYVRVQRTLANADNNYGSVVDRLHNALGEARSG